RGPRQPRTVPAAGRTARPREAPGPHADAGRGDGTRRPAAVRRLLPGRHRPRPRPRAGLRPRRLPHARREPELRLLDPGGAGRGEDVQPPDLGRLRRARRARRRHPRPGVLLLDQPLTKSTERGNRCGWPWLRDEAPGRSPGLRPSAPATRTDCGPREGKAHTPPLPRATRQGKLIPGGGHRCPRPALAPAEDTPCHITGTTARKI